MADINPIDKVINAVGGETFAVIWVSTLTLIILIYTIIYYVRTRGQANRNCNTFNSAYGTLAQLSPVLSSKPVQDPNCLFTLKDYYIKTAFNCCSGGDYNGGYLGTCVLADILRQGVRGLDFEVFSINNLPYVATTTYMSPYVKTTYNSIPFSDVLTILQTQAFTAGNVPNPTDPIIMHLRFNSENQTMFTALASQFQEKDSLFLGSAFSFENYGKNIGDIPLLSEDIMNKIIVVVNKSTDSSLDNASFKEYVNIVSGSAFMRYYTYFGLQNSSTLSDIQNYNKTAMTIVGPNPGSSPANPNAMGCRETGSQLIAMRYQLQDINLEENELFFQTAGYAYALKPARLRYVQVTVPDPTPQNPALSYQPQTTVLPYATITI